MGLYEKQHEGGDNINKTKILSAFLMLVMVLGTIGAVAADDSATFQGLDPAKSQGNQGVMDLKNNTDDSKMKGLCVQPLPMQYISTGDVVPITPGTAQVTENNKVKQLIANNYREDMTPQQGSDLQNAIWSLTTPTFQSVTPGAQLMLDALNPSLIIPDSGYKVQVGQTEVYDYTEIGVVTSEVGSSSTSTDVITKTGEVTTVVKETTDTCIKTITTVVESFNKQTTIDTITNYVRTTTTTAYYNVATKYLTFNFNSVISKCKQDLILFTATPSTEKSVKTVVKVVEEKFSKESQKVIDTPFDVTTVTEVCDPIVKPVEPVIKAVEEQKTIPMEKTGGEMLPGVLAVLAVLGGLTYGRLRK